MADSKTFNIKRLKISSPLYFLALLLILVLAGWVRVYNLDWDQGTHNHPDERFLTMVLPAISFPETLDQYWDTANSPLNPGNRGYASYVYGTFPLFATRATAMVVNQACGPEPTETGIALRKVLLGESGPCPKDLYINYSGIHLVGRVLSATSDLLTFLALALLARTLYGNATSLLAALLYAACVLPIQHAHFFVVDSFATVFVAWTLYFAALAVQGRSRGWLLPAGVFTGLAVSSKISVWPLAGVVALATFLVREITDEGESTYRFDLRWQPLVWGAVSGFLAALAFRVAQPYAFSGPGFFDVSFNPQWMATMKEIRRMISGLQDVPYGHQWTKRTPIVFPWSNMVFWGMGLPLGLFGWIGWGCQGWRIVHHRRWQHLLAWAWGTVFFLYQGTQWVKSMRYLLPVYPVFTLFAAWFGVRSAEWVRSTISDTLWKKILRPVLAVVPMVLVVGTIAWAMAFLHIYSEPISRIQASRWIYDNIQSAITIHTAENIDIQVPLVPGTMMSGDISIPAIRFAPLEDVTVTGVSLNKVIGIGVDGERVFSIKIQPEATSSEAAVSTSVTAHIPGKEFASVMADVPPLALSEGQGTFIEIKKLSGDAVRLQSSVIATEHWDDSLPMSIDGKSPFWNWYQSLSSSEGGQMTLYDNDTPLKREQLFNWLEEADYIVMSSNRLYASIPRLEMRYPFTTAYYKMLFSGNLGFDLLAEFVSYPTLGPCQFPDQEIPFDLMEPKYSNVRPCSITFPPAEEAYSVYDHSTVLIFTKTDAYSRERVAALLPESLLDDVQWMTPLQATKGGPEGQLLMNARTQKAQANGGTWSKLFHRSALKNRFQIVAVFLWWLALSVLGAMAFPWLYVALPDFRYRGYGMARVVGLLLWAYLAWLISSLHILPHTKWLLWAVLLLLVTLSVLFVRKRWGEFSEFFKANGRVLLRIEVIFAILYIGWVAVRFLNPDLWHPVAGGEKPMDFAYLNAVVKSTWFPPYDPWFSGGIMNYYYFGLVIVGSLIEALGIVPSVAYNLAVPSLFAMTGVGAYTLAYNFSGLDGKRAHRAGLIGLLATVLLGNMGELQMIFKGFKAVGNVQFESLIPGYPDLVSAVVGMWKVVVQGESMMFRPEWWYWNATRMVNDNIGVINEFPAFTFLYGDLHAHMIALPLTQVALAVALQWSVGKKIRLFISSIAHWGQWLAEIGHLLSIFLLSALVTGALRATNTWDYPTYLGLIGLSIAIALLKAHTPQARPKAPTPQVEEPTEQEESGGARMKLNYYMLLIPVLILIVAEILFRPFTKNYAVAYASFGWWQGQRTTLSTYLMMHGQFLFPLAALAVCQAWLAIRHFYRTNGLYGLFALVAVGFGGALMLVTFNALGAPVAWVVIPLSILAALLVLLPGHSSRMALLWVCVGTALVLSLLVEMVVLKGDIGRMNTVFKFYLQVWMLLAVAASVAVERILHWIWDSDHDARFGFVRDIVFALLVVIAFAAALYPAFAIPAKARDRWQTAAPHTLDGTAFISYATQYEHGGEIRLDVDYRVIRWLQDNVSGSPTIMEAQAEREYLWGNRISIYTGLPSVAAWRWHQVQQRMVMPSFTVESRQNDIRDFYNTTSHGRALEILRRYGVSYVILTPYERAYMLPEGEVKFSTMVDLGWLEIVYEEPKAKIYRVLVK